MDGILNLKMILLNLVTGMITIVYKIKFIK